MTDDDRPSRDDADDQPDRDETPADVYCGDCAWNKPVGTAIPPGRLDDFVEEHVRDCHWPSFSFTYPGDGEEGE